MRVLAINSGSSTLKFRVFAMETEACLLSVVLEPSGSGATVSLRLQYGDATDDPPAASEIPCDWPGGAFNALIEVLSEADVFAPTHGRRCIVQRVVQGGAQDAACNLIDDEVLASIRDATMLAPVHNPPAIAGIEAISAHFPGLSQLAVFDTGFFTGLPERASHYAIPEFLRREHGVHRFGYHGISHQFVYEQAASLLSPLPRPLRLISLHLGSGASAAATIDGRCIDTSMGMTPMEGLVMSTRSGDIDPGIVFFLARELNMSLSEIEVLLNRESGLKGLCGSGDMREIERRAAAGDERARLAIELYCYRICKTVGAFYVALGGLDCLAFTGGVGENSTLIRQRIAEGLAPLGVQIDRAANEAAGGGNRDLGSAQSQVRILSLPANEELHMARLARRYLAGRAGEA